MDKTPWRQYLSRPLLRTPLVLHSPEFPASLVILSFFQLIRSRIELLPLISIQRYLKSRFFLSHLFTLAEFNVAPSTCKDGVNSSDGISYTTIRKLHPPALAFLLDLFMGFGLTPLPFLWLTAYVIPVPKPDKNPHREYPAIHNSLL